MTGLMATVYVALVLSEELDFLEVRWTYDDAEDALIAYGRSYYEGYEFAEEIPEDRTEALNILKCWMKEDGMELIVMETTVT